MGGTNEMADNDKYFDSISEENDDVHDAFQFEILDGTDKYDLKYSKQFGAFEIKKIISRLDVKDDDEIIPSVKLLIHFHDGTSDKFIVPLEGLNKFDWEAFDERFLLSTKFTDSYAKRCLAYIIKVNLTNIPEEPAQYRISRNGTYIIEGVPVFYTGGELISPPGKMKPDVMLKQTFGRLVSDPELSEQQAVAGMVKINNLTPEAGKLIFAHSLLNVIRHVYISIGLIPCCILFLLGDTGTQKTTYANFQTYLYNRDKPIPKPQRLNASISAAEAIISQNSDRTVILDDLFPTTGATKRKQEETLEELVRIVGDNSGRARMKGDKVVVKNPRSGVIVTGEYLLNCTGSTAARLLPVKFITPIDWEKFDDCQREPLVLPTFYRYFITWYITEYFDIQDYLTKWLTESRSEKLGVHARLQETFFCLESTYRLFLNYCVEKGFTTLKNAEKEYTSFKSFLFELVKEQDGRVNQKNESENNTTDYLGLIRSMYKSKQFCLAKSKEKFNKEKHDGFEYGDCLCLRGENLLEKINKLIPTAKKKDVICALLSQKALKVGKNRSIQIIGTNGIRFYAIKLKKLL